MSILRVAGAYLAVPVEREADVVELLTIACNVGHGCYLRVLSCLDGILLCGQSVSVISHRIEDVKSLKALVACIYVRGNVAERMSHVQSCS